MDLTWKGYLEEQLVVEVAAAAQVAEVSELEEAVASVEDLKVWFKVVEEAAVVVVKVHPVKVKDRLDWVEVAVKVVHFVLKEGEA